MSKPVRSSTGAVGALGLAAVMALSACSTSDSGDGIATANTTTTIGTEVAEPTPDKELSEGAETGDAADGTEGGVIQTEADGTETTDPAGNNTADDETQAGDANQSPGDDSAGSDGETTSGETTDGETTDGDEASDEVKVSGDTETDAEDPETSPSTQPTETQPPDQEPAPVDEDPEDDPATEGRFELETPTGSLTDLTSGSVTELSAEVTGSYTLLWFWTPTTPSSEQEAPLVERFAETFAGSIDVVAVGSGGELSAAEQFHRSTELSVTTLWASSADSAEHYGVARVPSTLLIDSAGTIVGRWDGLPEEAFRLAERIA